MNKLFLGMAIQAGITALLTGFGFINPTPAQQVTSMILLLIVSMVIN